jgi:hypothetical protein
MFSLEGTPWPREIRGEVLKTITSGGRERWVAGDLLGDDEKRRLLAHHRESLKSWASILRQQPDPDPELMRSSCDAWCRAVGVERQVRVVDCATDRSVTRVIASQRYSESQLISAFRSITRQLAPFVDMLSLPEYSTRWRTLIDTLGRDVSYGLLMQAIPGAAPTEAWFRNWQWVVMNAIIPLSFSGIMRTGYALDLWNYGMTESDGDAVPLDGGMSFPAFLHGATLLRKAIDAGIGWLLDDGTTLLLLARPRLRLDRQFRLHHERQPAVEWSNGFRDYRWQGVRVNPRMLLSPGSMTARQVLEVENVELRRIMVARFGIDRFLTELKAEVIHTDYVEGRERRLLQVEVERDEPLVAVRVTCPSTGQMYLLRVSPRTRTCEEAVAWTFGLTPGNYAPVSES